MARAINPASADLKACIRWATWVAGAGTKENHIQALKREQAVGPEPKEREDSHLRIALECFLNLGCSPEFAEGAGPAQVDNPVSSGFAHAFPQRGIRHQCSNRAREVFHVV